MTAPGARVNKINHLPAEANAPYSDRPNHPKARTVITTEGRKLYVITSSLGTLKIGVSVSPITRLAQLQDNRDDALELAWVSDKLPEKTVFRMEKAAHKALHEYRYRGEWFKCSVKQAIEVLNAAMVSSYVPKKTNERLTRLSCSIPNETMTLLMKIRQDKETETLTFVSMASIVREALVCLAKERGVS